MSIKNEMEAIIFLGGDENKGDLSQKHFSISLEDTIKFTWIKGWQKKYGINIEINNEIVYLTTNPLYGDGINKYWTGRAS